MKLSEKLKLEREKKHFSQSYVADQLHLSRQSISKWENGHGYPDIDNLIFLYTLLNDTIYFFHIKETISLHEELISCVLK